MKRWMSLLLVGTLLVGMMGLTGCGGADETQPTTYEPVPTTEKLTIRKDETVSVAETDALELIAGNGSITLRNKINGSEWRSLLTDADYDLSSLSKIWKGTVQSLIKISYSMSRQSVQILSTTPVQEKADCTAYRIRDGVKFVYDFTDLQIELAVCLWLEDNQLVCRIPQAEVREYGTAILTSVEVMQFFGCAADADDGYFFYPDGSGALMEYRKVSEKKLSTKSYSWLVYGKDSEYLTDTSYSLDGNGAFYLPVFGAKVNNAGYVAMITAGDTDAKINLYTSALAVKRNRLCCEFVYRRTYDVYVTNLDGGSEVRSQYTNIDDEIIAGDREVRYFLLAGDGSYSEMANAVRAYMLATDRLHDSVADGDSVPLGVDLFVGTTTNALLSEYCSMTTFSECEEILTALSERGVTHFETALEGWNKDGYGTFPANYGVNAKAGGAGGLKSLAALIRKLGGKLYLNMNYVDVAAGGSRYSIKRDIIRNRSNSPVADENGTRYLLTGTTAEKWFQKDVRGLPDGVAGVAFEGFAKTLYNDYQVNRITERASMAEHWNAVLQHADKTLGSSAVYGGNAYLLNSATRLYDIPSEDSGFVVADRAVPFYQMVVHGCVAYSAEPANLFHDYSKQVLKLVEYGYMPYFKLTYERSEKLKNTDSNTLFTSYYASYLDKAAALYKDFSGDLGDTWNAYMTGHDEVANEVYCTTYSNGVRVYTNYTKADVTADGVTVPAENYTVVKGAQS